MRITKMPSMDNTEYAFACKKCGTEFIATDYECSVSITACTFEDYVKVWKRKENTCQAEQI